MDALRQGLVENGGDDIRGEQGQIDVRCDVAVGLEDRDTHK